MVGVKNFTSESQRLVVDNRAKIKAAIGSIRKKDRKWIFQMEMHQQKNRGEIHYQQPMETYWHL